jgi:hypothetical protein
VVERTWLTIAARRMGLTTWDKLSAGPILPLIFRTPLSAVLWGRNGIIIDLGTLAGDTLNAASNINFFGQVIGSSGNTLGFQGDAVTVIGRPFIWSARNGMRDLNSLISTRAGWVLNSATGLNIWGQIVGSGTRNGHSHGFLLTLSAPAKK